MFSAEEAYGCLGRGLSAGLARLYMKISDHDTIFNIFETINLYYNCLISMLCRGKEVPRQGVAVFCSAMRKQIYRIDIYQYIHGAARAITVFLLAAALLPASGFSQDTKAGLKSIRSGKTKTRAAGAMDLAKGRDKAASDGLVSAVKAEKDPDVRLHLVDAMGNVGGAAAAAELAGLARNDLSADVRAMSCLKLGTLNDKTSVPALKEIALNDKEETSVRIAAAGGLTFYLDEAGVPGVFEEVLKGKNTALKTGVVNALARVKRNETGRRLIELAAKDPAPAVKTAAEQLLKDDK